MTTIIDIAAQIDETTAFEARTNKNGGTVTATKDSAGYHLLYRAYEQVVHELYFGDVECMAQVMATDNADPAAWVRITSQPEPTPTPTINDIIAQLTDSVGFEAPYTDDGRYTAFVTFRGSEYFYSCPYRVAYMYNDEYIHGEYFDADQLANEMTNLNADPAAWVRWECVDGDWQPAEAASDTAMFDE